MNTELPDSGLASDFKVTRRYYLSRPTGLRKLHTFLAKFWDNQLDLLHETAEAEEAKCDP